MKKNRIPFIITFLCFVCVFVASEKIFGGGMERIFDYGNVKKSTWEDVLNNLVEYVIVSLAITSGIFYLKSIQNPNE